MKETYTKPLCDVINDYIIPALDVVTTSGIDDTQKGDTDLPFGD